MAKRRRSRGLISARNARTGKRDLELEAAAQLQYGMPAALGCTWTREHRFAPPRRWRFDFAELDLRIALEIEGQSPQSRHMTFDGYRKDIEKYNCAAILGWLVIRATADELFSGIMLAWVIEAAEARQEWTPGPKFPRLWSTG